MPTTYIYVRCSHLDSSQSGLGLEAQELSARGYYNLAHERGLIETPLGEVFIDREVSAYKVPLLARPQGCRMGKKLRAGDHVIFARLDRAFRSVKDFANIVPSWLKRDITPHFADKMIDMGSANGRLMAHMLVAVAEWESAIKSERVKEAMAVIKARKGAVNSKVLNGCKKIRRGGKIQFIPDPIEESVIQEIARLREEEGLDFFRISDRIEQRMAEFEGREPIPRSVWRPRKYNHDRCKRLYNHYREQQAIEAGQAVAIVDQPTASRQA